MKIYFHPVFLIYGVAQVLECVKMGDGVNLVADNVVRKDRILCMVLTFAENHNTKSIHVKNTWGKRCDKLIFMSSKEDASLGAVDLNVPEGKAYLWGKTKAAFRYVYKHHRNDAEWFMKADDDTYVILENLRYIISLSNSSLPICFGRRYLHSDRKYRWIYMTGGAGYVLSRAALHLVVNKGLKSPRLCRRANTGPEDIFMSLCLRNSGVLAVNTRDALDRERFFQNMPLEYHQPTCWKNCPYPTIIDGMNGSSDTAVSFHHISPKDMYVLEYLVYRLRPYTDVTSTNIEFLEENILEFRRGDIILIKHS